MSDIHALSGAYAVDALDDVERARFERHLAECPECRAEVDSLREAASLLPETLATSPPPHLRDRVLGDIATVRPLPPPAVPPRRRRRLRPLVAAAAAVAVVSLAGGVVAWQPWDDDTSQAPMSPVDRVLRAADAEEYTQTFPDGSSATLTRSPSLNQAVLVTEDMAPPPEGKVYELWLDQEGVGMVPAGLMPREPDAVMLLEGDPATALGAGITLEPEGGSERPTGEPIAVIAFDEA